MMQFQRAQKRIITSILPSLYQSTLSRAVPTRTYTLRSSSSSSSSLLTTSSSSLLTKTSTSLSPISSRFFSEGGHDHHGDFLERDEVQERVLSVLNQVDKIPKEKLNATVAFKDLGLDSLDEVEVVMMLEEEFEIDIQDEVASNILSVKDAIDYISNHPFAM